MIDEILPHANDPTTGQDPRSAALLSVLITLIREYIELEDDGIVLCALAWAAIGLEVGEAPLWLMLVGVPSCGKSEAIKLLKPVLDATIDNLTSAGLLSWSNDKKNPGKVGLLSQMTVGLAAISDFSTVLGSGNDNSRDQLFADLRTIFDGSFTRYLGNTTQPLNWVGQLSLIAACTPRIDDFSGHSDALGPRWLNYRAPSRDLVAKRRQLAAMGGGDRKAQSAQAQQVANLVVRNAAGQLPFVALSLNAERAVNNAAITVAYGRATVARESYGARDIIGMPIVEDPPRVRLQLRQMLRGLLAIGVEEGRALELMRKCATDSMRPERKAALSALSKSDTCTTREIARTVPCDRKVAQRTLEELVLAGVVEECEENTPGSFKPKIWKLCDKFQPILREVFHHAGAGQAGDEEGVGHPTGTLI